MRIIALLTLTLFQAAAFADGSTFGKIWSQVASDPYSKLPQNRVTVSSFFSFTKDKLKADARRTTTSRVDILPRFNKLVHPNGICLAGTWNITQENPYTGYFTKGSRGLIIARASVAMSDTTVGNYRGFGFAGKLFPTMDAAHQNPVSNANFFLVDDLAGTKARNYTDVGMTNHPDVTKRLSLSLASIGITAARAFGAVDSNPLIRQMYEVAELGMANPAASHTPDYFMLKAAPGQRVNAADFRDELRMKNRGGRLVFDIFVASSKEAPWNKIGYVEFKADAASDSCDHRLHFSHPKWRNRLN